jgi:hypothetical protein
MSIPEQQSILNTIANNQTEGAFPARGMFRNLKIRREHLGEAGERQERPPLRERSQDGGLARHIFRMGVLAPLWIPKGLLRDQSKAGEKLRVSGYRQWLKAVAQKPEILG